MFEYLTCECGKRYQNIGTLPQMCLSCWEIQNGQPSKKKVIIFQDALSFILDCSNIDELLILNLGLAHQLKTRYEDYHRLLEEVL